MCFLLGWASDFSGDRIMTTTLISLRIELTSTIPLECHIILISYVLVKEDLNFRGFHSDSTGQGSVVGLHPCGLTSTTEYVNSNYRVEDWEVTISILQWTVPGPT